MTTISRRQLMVAGVAAIGAAAMPAFGQAAPVRRSINGMALNDPDLEAYRRAVAAMKALPQSDVRNWRRQAEIHRNFCPHSNWYFLPWHRAYLVAFEQICRELSGKADFALPFWDWTANRNLPEPFISGNAQNNILFHPRQVTAADAIGDEDVGPDVINRVLRSSDFESFGSTRPGGQNSADPSWLRRAGQSTDLEGTAHNGVHVFISGDMGTFLSPLDPIFWLHHCNVDRLWHVWNEQGRQNSSNPFWSEMHLLGQFVDGKSQPYAPTVGNLGSISPLGYRYPGNVSATTSVVNLQRRLSAWRDFSAGALIGARLTDLTASQSVRTLNLEGGAASVRAILQDQFSRSSANIEQPLSAPISIGVPLRESVQSRALTPTGTRPSDESSRRVLASIIDVTPPVDRRTKLRIFVNCPYLSPKVGTSDRHYAATFSFFGSPDDHAGHGGDGDRVSYSVDLTDALTRVYGNATVAPEEVVVQFMPVNAVAKDVKQTEITAKSVAVTVL